MDAVHGQGRLAPDPRDAAAGAVEVLLVAFRGWLICERGLATESVRCYGSQTRTFLAQLPAPLEESLAGLDAAAVITLVLGQAAAANSIWAAKAQVTALHSLLRFLHVHTLIPMSLTAAVPGVAGWRSRILPKTLGAGQVQTLRGAHDLSTAVGLRDHAVLLTLARLGLRGAEVATLDSPTWTGGPARSWSAARVRAPNGFRCPPRSARHWSPISPMAGPRARDRLCS